MRGCMKSVLAFGLVALMGAPALAQGGRGGMGGGMGGVTLISNPSVQKELKMDATQVEKAQEVAQGLRTKQQEMRSSLENLDQEERMKKMQEMAKSYNEEGMKTLATLLKPEQLARFKQIELQTQGVNAFSDPAVVKALKVTDEQVEKVKTLLADQRTEMMEAMQAANGDRQASMEAQTKIRKATNTKAMALMTADQKKAWKEMTGEPFEVVPGPRPARN